MADSPVLVLGAGSWGTALALVLARNGLDTRLWDVDVDHVRALARERENRRHLNGIRFPECLQLCEEPEPVAGTSRDIIVSVPCEALRDVLARIAGVVHADTRFCLACKGLEPDTLMLNHEVVKECLGARAVAVLSGPSFAREVAQGLPTAVTIAAAQAGTAARFADLFHGDTFRIYTHDDMAGAEVGGAVKNVMAIAAGISDGLGFGANARAALITRGLAEIIRLGTAMGGRPETFMGLAGLGDLVLTCTDDQSRNRRLGLALARGLSVEAARREIGQAIEGLRTADVVHELARTRQVDMPISEQVYRVIHGEVTPQQAVRTLLARERRDEAPG